MSVKRPPSSESLVFRGIFCRTKNVLPQRLSPSLRCFRLRTPMVSTPLQHVGVEVVSSQVKWKAFKEMQLPQALDIEDRKMISD